MPQISDSNTCDFCYADAVDWEAKLRCVPRPWLGWEFKICDSCRLLLRNVIAVVLHRVNHSDVVAALVDLLDQRGLTFADLLVSQAELEAAEEANGRRTPDGGKPFSGSHGTEVVSTQLRALGPVPGAHELRRDGSRWSQLE